MDQDTIVRKITEVSRARRGTFSKTEVVGILASLLAGQPLDAPAPKQKRRGGIKARRRSNKEEKEAQAL